MLFVNTRPSERANTLSQAVKKLGYDVLELPLLTLTALPFDEELKQQFEQFKYAEIVVVVSPLAVEVGMKYSQLCGISLQELQQKQWISVGKTTSDCLKKYQIESITPKAENSEGMLELSLLKSCQQKKIVFWRGIGGRTLMIEQLKQKNHIINILLYQRAMPEFFANPLQHHLNQNMIVLISSEASWQNWLEIHKKFKILQNLAYSHYIVLGSRVFRIVQEYLKNMNLMVNIEQIECLNPENIHIYLEKIHKNLV